MSVPAELEPHMGHTITAEMVEKPRMAGDLYVSYEPTGELNCSCGEQLRPKETT